MDRKKYLKLCCEISTLPQGAAGTLSRPPPELLVSFDGSVYYPLYYEMKFSKGEYQDIAVLHDLKVNSLIHAPLGKVGEYIAE